MSEGFIELERGSQCGECLGPSPQTQLGADSSARSVLFVFYQAKAELFYNMIILTTFMQKLW